MKRKTLWLTAAACLLALLIGLTGCSPKKAAPGSSAPEQKTVTIEVIHKDKTQKEFQILSAAEYLATPWWPRGSSRAPQATTAST